MRNLKKFLALVLAMMMTLSLMVTANAATSSADLNLTDSESVSGVFLEDIQVLTGMEVIKGYPDGSFKPQVEINRHQMATFIYRMTTGDTKDLKDVYLSEIAAEKFPDVKAEDSYAGYIGYCWVNGYIAGFPDGTFKPMNKVTGYQALVMILRAMGYNNPNDNFTGSDWQSLALSRARMNNLLVNIDKSVYSSTFSRPAPRELVAEMVFQGLIQPQVTYTPAMGYQKYGMEGGVLSNILNPTLGYENFGLTNHKGVVVGNQGSGEKFTKVGFSLDVATEKGLNVGDHDLTAGTAWTVTGSVTGADFNDTLNTNAYYYDSKLYVVDNKMEGNVTLSFDWESDLKLFNHAVDVWYDYRGATTNTVSYTKPATSNFNAGSVTFRDELKTYAVFDRVKGVEVDTATWAYDPSADVDPTNPAMDMDHVFGATANTLYNYAFAPMNILQDGNHGAMYEYNLFGDGILNTSAMPSASAASPIQANNGSDTYVDTATTDLYPLYLAIDNTGDEKADVIISLNLTMTKVVQDNNTQAPLTTGVLSRNGASTVSTGYFDLWDQVTPVPAAPEYSNIADAHLLNSDGTTLGKYVSAMTITGTTGNNTGVDATPVEDAAEGNAKAITGINSTYYYQVNELTKTVEGTMIKYDQDTDKVYINVNGTTQEIERSVFALATDGSFQPNLHVFAPRESGTYTFYLDEEGDWLFWEQGSTSVEFIYATYIDYTSKLLSSGFDYPLLYVDAAGEPQQQVNVTSINNPNPDTNNMDDSVYMGLFLPKRTNTSGNSTGFVRGQYVGYAMSGGRLTAITSGNDYRTGFLQAANAANDFGQADTVIDGTSVAIGAHPTSNAGNMFLTERTKFVVVDGAGTNNQTAKVYTGLKEFLGSSESVTIAGNTAPINPTGSYLAVGQHDVAGTDYAGESAPWEMIYYKTEEDPYAQSYDQMDKHVDTVFIPAPMVKRVDPAVTGNLFFVGDNQYALIDEGSNATQYTFYQNGEASVRWITGRPTTTLADGVTPTDAKIITDFGDNVFYQLAETTGRAGDGGIIYKLIPVKSLETADKLIIGNYYGYGGTDAAPTGTPTTAVVNTTETATVLYNGANATAATAYLATTRNSQVAYMGLHGDDARTANDLYNVASAGVKNLNDDYTINSIGDLNDQSSLKSNQGVSVSCTLSGEKAVSFIYVNY